MMWSIARIVASVAFVIVSSRQAGAAIIPILQDDFSEEATVIDFETGSTALPDVPGVTFVDEGNPATPPWFDGNSSFSGFFGDQFGEQKWSNLSSITYSDLALEFDTPIHAIGGWIGRAGTSNSSADEVVVELFDQAGASLGFDTVEIPIPDPFNEPVFFGYTADAPIARIEIRGNDTGFFGVDNVTFETTSSVPEPSSLSLCGLVSLTLIGIRSRRGRNMKKRG